MKIRNAALVALAISLYAGMVPADVSAQCPPGQTAAYLRICPRFRLSCFTPETKILMGDQKTEKEIYKIAYGEKVWNPVRKMAMPVKNLTAGPEALPMLEIGYAANVVRVTQGHPMVVLAGNSYTMTKAALRGGLEKAPAPESFQVKKARDITFEDSVLGADGEYHQVTKIALLPVKADQSVWNVNLDTDSEDPADHMIVAEGIVTADVKIQTKMAQE